MMVEVYTSNGGRRFLSEVGDLGLVWEDQDENAPTSKWSMRCINYDGAGYEVERWDIREALGIDADADADDEVEAFVDDVPRVEVMLMDKRDGRMALLYANSWGDSGWTIEEEGGFGGGQRLRDRLDRKMVLPGHDICFSFQAVINVVNDHASMWLDVTVPKGTNAVDFHRMVRSLDWGGSSASS